MTTEGNVESLARAALAGDTTALDSLIRDLQPTVFRLALRMMWNREDAEDATQEILVRTVTRLSTFDFQSRLQTWVYRVAVNYLLDVKKSAVERMNMSFVDMGQDLVEGLSNEGPGDEEHSVLIEEVKFGCTVAMLQCLDRPHRLAYILCEILDLPGPEAAIALEIGPEVLRKRLERARTAILNFTREHCGLVTDSAPCGCHRRVPQAMKLGRIDPLALQFAEHSVSFADVRATVRKAGAARAALELHRSTRPREPTVKLTRRIVAAFSADAAMSNDRN